MPTFGPYGPFRCMVTMLAVGAVVAFGALPAAALDNEAQYKA